MVTLTGTVIRISTLTKATIPTNSQEKLNKKKKFPPTHRFMRKNGESLHCV